MYVGCENSVFYLMFGPSVLVFTECKQDAISVAHALGYENAYWTSQEFDLNKKENHEILKIINELIKCIGEFQFSSFLNYSNGIVSLQGFLLC